MLRLPDIQRGQRVSITDWTRRENHYKGMLEDGFGTIVEITSSRQVGVKWAYQPETVKYYWIGSLYPVGD